MNRRIVLLWLFAAILFASLGNCTHPVRADSNDFTSFPSGITLFSPINTTYNSQYLTLNLTLYSAGGFGSIDSQVSMHYSIDGTDNGPVPLMVSNPGFHLITNAAASLSLPELSEGSHYLTLYLYGYNQRTYEPQFLSYTNTVYFSIDLTPQDLTRPSVFVLSPENKTYVVANFTTANIPLNFIVNEKTSQLSYSLDGYDNATIGANTSLTGLSIGPHNMTTYARDLAGNTGASETVNFTIAAEQEPNSESEPEPFPTLTNVAAVSVAVSLAVAGLLVYHKKHKR